MRWLPLIALMLVLTAIYLMALPTIARWSGHPLRPAVSTINGATLP